jgi:hypothetical protein
MAQRKITEAMIRKYFGLYASIEKKLFGGFRVTTPTGGDVEIQQDKYTIHAGGHDVHAAMAMLGGEAWGGITAQGPPEFIMAMMAHGEFTGVNVIPVVKPGSGCGAFILTVIVFLIVLGLTAKAGSPGATVIAALVAWWVWWLMKKGREREAQRQAQALRYTFPLIHGSARYSSDEDLRRGGLT